MLDDIATTVENNLDVKFPNHSPFRCVEIYIEASILFITVLDNTCQGYTLMFNMDAECGKIISDFIEIFDETYQYDDI